MASKFISGCQAKGGFRECTQIVRILYLPQRGDMSPKTSILLEMKDNNSGVVKERFSLRLANGRKNMEMWKALTKAVVFYLRQNGKTLDEIAEILNYNARTTLADIPREPRQEHLEDTI